MKRLFILILTFICLSGFSQIEFDALIYHDSIGDSNGDYIETWSDINECDSIYTAGGWINPLDTIYKVDTTNYSINADTSVVISSKTSTINLIGTGVTTSIVNIQSPTTQGAISVNNNGKLVFASDTSTFYTDVDLGSQSIISPKFVGDTIRTIEETLYLKNQEDNPLNIDFYGSTNNIQFKTNGTNTFYFNENIVAYGVKSWELKNRTPSNTTTSIVPYGSDDDTGIGYSGSDSLSLIAGGEQQMEVRTNGISIKDTLWVDAVNIQDSIIHNADSSEFRTNVKFKGGIEIEVTEGTWGNPVTYSFANKSFWRDDVTSDGTVNVSDLPMGKSTLWLELDGSSRTITIGTGWGTAIDNTATLSTTANAINIIEFLNDGTTTVYGIVTIGD